MNGDHDLRKKKDGEGLLHTAATAWGRQRRNRTKTGGLKNPD